VSDFRNEFIGYRRHDAGGDRLSSWQRDLANFVGRVESAAVLLSFGHDRPPAVRATSTRMAAVSLGNDWKAEILRSVSERLSEIVTVLVNAETHKSRSASIDLEAFDTLASLTLAPDELHILHQQDKAEALRELVKQLEIAWERVATTATLVSKVESAAPSTEASDNVLTVLLEKAGGTLGLTKASERLGISRQALHKKVYAGNALGMMHDDRIVLPKLQFVTVAGKTKILPGIDRVAKTFNESNAGPFSALQFLIEIDPNLEARPIDVLENGDADAVHQAARAYLSMDEG
jgi:hypothetical protein